MMDVSTLPLLKGKKALVTGIANDQSIAWGCAKAFRTFGAELAITYLNEKAKPYVEPLAREVGAEIFMPLNVQVEGQLEAVFDAVGHQWGKLTSAFIRSRLRRRRTCRDAWWTAPRPVFSARWMFPAGRSSAWLSSPSPLMKDGGTLIDHDLLRVANGGRALQHNGAGEGCAQIGHTLSRGRTRP